MIEDLIAELEQARDKLGNLPMRVATGLSTSLDVLGTWFPDPDADECLCEGEEPELLLMTPESVADLEDFEKGLPRGDAGQVN